MATGNNVSPQLEDFIAENITQNTKLLNSHASNPRLIFVMNKLVDHLHAFARETRLTTEEWRAALKFIIDCGQISNNAHPQLNLVSSILGLTTLIFSMNNPKINNSTETASLGPFYNDDAPEVANGESIASPGKGEVCLILATVKDTKGAPIEGIKVDVWETDGDGRYDNQYAEQDRPDMRGRLTSNENGEFYFKCVKPIAYSIPSDGPAGKLLRMLNRGNTRPAHIHFRFSDPKKKYNDLITMLYIRGDPHELDDPVIDVRSSLVVDLLKVEDASIAQKYGVNEQDWLIKYNFVLTTPEETQPLLTVPTHI